MDLQKHLRNTFLAGAFAVMPIAATAFIIWYVESTTRRLFGAQTPFAALLLALAAVYVLGLVVRSIVGKVLIGWVDRVLSRIPLLRDVYEAWKHVSVTPGGKEGIFARAVLIGADTGGRVLGFSSGEPLEGDPDTFCVFVPNAPNPVGGRLLFVARRECLFLDVSMEEAFKSILSTGNYVPPGVGRATAKAAPAPARVDGLVRT